MNEMKTFFGWIDITLANGDLFCYVGDQCAGYIYHFKVGENREECVAGFNLEYVYVLNSTTLIFYVVNLRTHNKTLKRAELSSSDYKFSVIDLLEPSVIPKAFPNIISTLGNAAKFPAILPTFYGAFVILPSSGSTEICTVKDENIILNSFPKTIVQASSGNNHLLLLTSDNEVYCMGVGSRGELGQEEIITFSEIPIKVSIAFEEDTEHIVLIRSGGWHNIVLTDAGNIYSWGLNDKDQCGFGEKVPCFVDLKKPVKYVEIGQKWTIVTFVDGEVLRL
ncbi:unnamed protein product [Bursaphelenchus xylophilus]|uniref:(pine wood nematode) hypothetical protein n=1 Tax=Bursaphelenchus xylophilus TaxID=6326 RepID=A0A811JZP7_BURXY|nr:unnamed protein product [Bursaphelenchus xylophilus]CAG9083716.1 unnamed protein product [Bursaphelenchus xylophilus]